MKTQLPDDLPDFSRKELEELFQVWLGEIPLKSPEEWRIDFMEVDSGSFHILVISRQTGDLADPSAGLHRLCTHGHVPLMTDQGGKAAGERKRDEYGVQSGSWTVTRKKLHR